MRAKKLVILYAVILFLVVFAITFNSVCSIARFDVSFEVFSMADEAQAVQRRLEEEYNGKSYLFFGEEDVTGIVEEEGKGYFELEGFTKTFPNVISFRVREKCELFSLESGGVYYAVDKENTVLSKTEGSAVSNLGGSNTAVYGIGFADAQVGQTLLVAEEDAAAYAAVTEVYEQMDEVLGGARSNVLSIRYDNSFEGLVGGVSSLCIEMREGVMIWLIDPLESAGDKARAATERYLALSDAQRTYGYITASSGSGSADYTEETPPFLA